MRALIPLLPGLWLVVLFVLERVWPATTTPTDYRRIAHNLSFGVMALAASPLIQWGTAQLVPGFASPIPVQSLVIHLLILDLWAYLLHRAYHRLPFMWRMHAVHHLDEHLDASSAVRFHVFEILWSSLLRLIPLSLFGIPLETNLLYGAILTASAMFHHSNLRLPASLERALSFIIVTPAIHWVHHHAVQRDTDSNYASILSVWDRLLSSASRTRRWAEMPIGVEGARELGLGRLLRYPVSPG